MDVTEIKNIYENLTQACQSIMICENRKQTCWNVTNINENHDDLWKLIKNFEIHEHDNEWE